MEYQSSFLSGWGSLLDIGLGDSEDTSAREKLKRIFFGDREVISESFHFRERQLESTLGFDVSTGESGGLTGTGAVGREAVIGPMVAKKKFVS